MASPTYQALEPEQTPQVVLPVVCSDVILGEAALQQSDQQLAQQRRLVPLRQQALLQVLPTGPAVTSDVRHAPVTAHRGVSGLRLMSHFFSPWIDPLLFDALIPNIAFVFKYLEILRSPRPIKDFRFIIFPL